MQRNRPGLVALVAVIVEAAIIAGIGNQSVTQSINDRVGTSPTSFGDRALQSLTTFQWRFTPQDGVPAQHLWGAQFAAIGVFLLLTYLFVLCLSRRRTGGGQDLLGVWLAVIVAAVGGIIVRGIVYPFTVASSNRVAVGVFDFPTGEVTFFGALCGIVVAVIAASVVVTTRRTVAEPAPVTPVEEYEPYPYQNVEAPPPFERPGPPAPGQPGYGVPAYDRPSYTGPGYPPVVPAGEPDPAGATEQLSPSAAAEARTEVRPGPAAAAEPTGRTDPTAPQPAAAEPAAPAEPAAAAETPAPEPAQPDPPATPAPDPPATPAPDATATPAPEAPAPVAPAPDAHTEVLRPVEDEQNSTAVLPQVPDEQRPER